MRHYLGEYDRATGLCNVRVEDDERPARALPLRLDLSNHSPTGFAWGYGGSGPAQLALALLADATGDDRRALRLHQQFKFAYVSQWKRDVPWHLSQAAVIGLARALEKRQAEDQRDDEDRPGGQQ